MLCLLSKQPQANAKGLNTMTRIINTRANTITLLHNLRRKLHSTRKPACRLVKDVHGDVCLRMLVGAK